MARRFATFLLDILPGLVLLAALALALWMATGHVRTAYAPGVPASEAFPAPEWTPAPLGGSRAVYRPLATSVPTPSSEAVIPAVGIPVSDVSAQPQSGAPEPGSNGKSAPAPVAPPPQAAKGGSAAPRLAAIGTSLSAGPTPTANPRLTKQNLATAAPSVDAGSCTTPCFVRVPPDPWHRAVATSYGIGDGYLWGHMACGGRLDNTALVVAHRTLPCGQHVLIAFRGHVVEAVVRDRGPYVAGRTWDLGPAVARAIHFNGLDWVLWKLVP